MLTITYSYAQDLPLDFETSPVTADLVGFDGGVMTVEAVVAPQSTGNTSTKLAKLVKGAGAVWAGAKIILDTPFDFSTKSNIEVRIYTTAPIGSKIEFKAEQDIVNGASSGPKLAYTTKTGEWETLTFDFSGVAQTNLTALVMIPYMPGDAQGDGSEAATFYFDDIVQTEPPLELPLDFETSPVTADLVGFDGGVMTVEAVVAPQSTGNTSTKLAKLVKGAGAVWAGAKIILDTPFDFSTKSNIEVRIYTTAPIGSKIEFKAEQDIVNGASSGPKLAYTTKTGEWETLTFDFSGVAQTNLTALVMIPYMPGDAQGDGSEAATFYFDDIVQTEPSAATCTDGIQNGDETGIDCGGSSCATCPEITLPLDFSDASQLFTHVGDGAGGSVVMEGGQMRFNGNGQAYDQAYLDLTTSFSLMNAENNTFTVTMNPLLVPDGEERTHLIKASIGSSATSLQIEGKSIGSGSQEVTFNFGTMLGAEAWDRITIFMDFGPDGANTYNGKTTSYLISGITLGADPVVPQVPPTVAAPTAPARNAADVISIYSKTTDAASVYADIAGVSFPTWGHLNGAPIPEAFENDLALKLPTFTYQGVEFPETDLSGMTMLHLDIWAQAQNVGLDLIATVGGAKRVNIASNDGEWSSVDIALSDFTGLNLSQIFQMKFYGFDGANADGSLDIYLDNIYFYTGSPLSTDKNNIVNVSLYPNPAKGSLNISAKNTIENATIYNVLGKKIKSFTVNAKTSSLDVSGLSRGIYILKYTANNAVGSMKFVKE